MSLALLTLVSVALSQAALPANTVSSLSVEDEPVLKVWVDEANHEVVIEAGPFHVPAKAPAAAAGDHMASMHHHSEHERSPLMRVAWPVEGWLRGFSLTLRESDGSELPQELLHHFVAVNFSRRQLVYPVGERLFAVGQETTDVLLPPSIGVPIDRGAELGFYAMWSNTLGRDLDFHLETRIPFLSADRPPQMDVLPLYMDVNNVIGETSTFDLPPGESTRAWEFEVPGAGRVLMMGGHLHDYGRWVRLEDAETDEVLVQVNGTSKTTANSTESSGRSWGSVTTRCVWSRTTGTGSWARTTTSPTRRSPTAAWLISWGSSCRTTSRPGRPRTRSRTSTSSICRGCLRRCSDRRAKPRRRAP